MLSPQDYANRIKALGLDKLEINIRNLQEAKTTNAQLRVLKKQLQQIKKEIAVDIKTIKAKYQAQIPQAGSGGGGFLRTVGVFGVKGMKGQAKQYQALAKQDLRNRQHKELDPYERVKLTVDDLITQIDATLIKINAYILKNQ